MSIRGIRISQREIREVNCAQLYDDLNPGLLHVDAGNAQQNKNAKTVLVGVPEQACDIFVGHCGENHIVNAWAISGDKLSTSTPFISTNNITETQMYLPRAETNKTEQCFAMLWKLHNLNYSTVSMLSLWIWKLKDPKDLRRPVSKLGTQKNSYQGSFWNNPFKKNKTKKKHRISSSQPVCLCRLQFCMLALESW